MSGFQVSSARRATAVVCLTACFLLDASALADQPSELIAPVQRDLLIRSYQRCLNASSQHGAPANDAALFAGAYPFDLDALSLLKNSDIGRAPRERVRGLVYLRCEWFGFRRSG